MFCFCPSAFKVCEKYKYKFKTGIEKVPMKKLQAKNLANFNVFHVSAHFFKVFYQEVFYAVYTASTQQDKTRLKIKLIKSFVIFILSSSSQRSMLCRTVLFINR